jgi:LytS/YehU family sensor histidine kinase
MENFIQLIKLRLTDQVSIIYNFPTEKNSHLIAPLLFIPILENAFKHGISANQQSEINFQFALKENEISLEAVNSNFPKLDEDKSGSGIGLTNLRKRLELLYPENYTFTTQVRNGKFIAILKLKMI